MPATSSNVMQSQWLTSPNRAAPRAFMRPNRLAVVVCPPESRMA